MKVKLISKSTDDKGSSLKDLVIYCARVSNVKSQELGNNPDRLMKYLMDNKHWSPFEMVNICMEIETPRDIARQILRHRSFSFQEFSQRYADPTEDLGFEDSREIRLQDTENRQNSIITEDMEVVTVSSGIMNYIVKECEDAYKHLVGIGVAKEVARAILPEGLTMSRMYMNGSLRSWLHYLEVRSDPSTQKEHREVAEECGKIITKLMQ